MTTLSTLLSKVKRHAYSMYVSLFIEKNDRAVFKKNASEAAKRYREKHQLYNYEEFLMPSWKKNTQEIEAVLIAELPFSFLRDQTLKRTMFAHMPKSTTELQKNFLKSHMSAELLTKTLKENSTGRPILNDFEFKSSGNSIHHLYHLAKYSSETEQEIIKLDHVLEYGGGYGNMARLVKKINRDATYTIVDIPVFAYIQLVYLRSIFGSDAVTLFDETHRIVEGKINIVPLDTAHLNLLARSDYVPSLFTSTWALSESNKKTQKTVFDFDYFKAEKLLLAYQKSNDSFKYAQDIEKLPPSYTINYKEELDYLENNYYLFASRK